MIRLGVYWIRISLVILVVFTTVQNVNATPRMREVKWYANDRIRVMVNDGDPVRKGYLLAKMLQEFNREFFQDSVYFFVMIGEEKPYGERTDTSYYYAGFNIDTFHAHFGKSIQGRAGDSFSRGKARNALCLYVYEKYDFTKCFSLLYYLLSHKAEIKAKQSPKMFERTDDEPDRFANVIPIPDSAELSESRGKLGTFLRRKFSVDYPLFNTANCPVSIYFSAGRFHLYTLQGYGYEKVSEKDLDSKVIGSFDDIYYVYTFDKNNLLVAAGDGHYYINVKEQRLSGPIDIKPIIPGYWGEIMFDKAYGIGERIYIDVYDNLQIWYTLVYNESTKELAVHPESLTKRELRYYFNFFQRQMEDSIKWSKKHAVQQTLLTQPLTTRTNIFLAVFTITAICFGVLYLRIK